MRHERLLPLEAPPPSPPLPPLPSPDLAVCDERGRTVVFDVRSRTVAHIVHDPTLLKDPSCACFAPMAYPPDGGEVLGVRDARARAQEERLIVLSRGEGHAYGVGAITRA